MSTAAEWTRFGSFDGLRLQALRARFYRHAYGRHTHDEHVFGVVHSGAVAFRYRGAAHDIQPSGIMMLDPQEVHDGRPAANDGFLKSVVYIHPQALADLIGDASERFRYVGFREAVVRDSEVADRITSLCTAILDRSGRLDIESELAETFVLVASRYGSPVTVTANSPRCGAAIARARELLHASFERDVGLGELAAAAGLSRFHLIRSFAAETGLTPHAYLTRVRLDAAKRLIERGVAAADVASSVGFSDQSHLIRRFKRFYGITPAQFAQSVSKWRPARST